METVNNLFLDAVEYQEYLLAYSLYIARQKGIVNFSDTVDTINYDEFPHDIIQEAIKNDTLGLIANSIKLFIAKQSVGDWAVYFAKSKKEVCMLHLNLFGEQPLQVIDKSEAMDSSIWDQERKKYISFREIKKQTVVFPRYLFLMNGKSKSKSRSINKVAAS